MEKPDKALQSAYQSSKPAKNAPFEAGDHPACAKMRHRMHQYGESRLRLSADGESAAATLCSSKSGGNYDGLATFSDCYRESSTSTRGEPLARPAQAGGERTVYSGDGARQAALIATPCRINGIPLMSQRRG